MKIINVYFKNAKFLTAGTCCGNNPLRYVNRILNARCIDDLPRVFKALDFKDKGIPLYYVSNGRLAEGVDLDENTYVVVDGAEIITSVQYINSIASTEAETTTVVSAKFTIDTMNMLLLGVEDLHGRSIEQYYLDIHKSIDETDNPLAELQRDQNLAVMHLLKDAGVSMSCMSRYLTFNPKVLNERMLFRGVEQNRLSMLDFRVGMTVLIVLLNAGFSLKLLKKSYIIDYIIGESGIGRLNDSMAMLSGMSKKDIEYLETMVPSNEVKTFLGRKTTDFVNSAAIRSHETIPELSKFYDIVSLYNDLDAAINKEQGKSRQNKKKNSTFSKINRQWTESDMWHQVSKVKDIMTEDAPKSLTLPVKAHHEVASMKPDREQKIVPLKNKDEQGNEDKQIHMQDNTIKVLEVKPNTGSSDSNSDSVPVQDLLSKILSGVPSSASPNNRLAREKVVKRSQLVSLPNSANHDSYGLENDMPIKYAPPSSNIGRELST